MLEPMVAMLNLQRVVAENVGPPLGYIVVTNLMYGLPPDYVPHQGDIPTKP